MTGAVPSGASETAMQRSRDKIAEMERAHISAQHDRGAEFHRLERQIVTSYLLKIRSAALLQVALEDAAVCAAFGGYKACCCRLEFSKEDYEKAAGATTPLWFSQVNHDACVGSYSCSHMLSHASSNALS